MRLRVGTAGGRPHPALPYQKSGCLSHFWPMLVGLEGCIEFHLIMWISWLNWTEKLKRISRRNDRQKVDGQHRWENLPKSMTARVISVLSVVHQEPSVCQWCTCWLESRLRTLAARSSSTYYWLAGPGGNLSTLLCSPFCFLYEAVNIPSRFSFFLGK